MPPRKSSTSLTKRKTPSSPPPKAAVGSESDLSELSAEEEKPSKAKKPKKGPVVPIHPDLPNNTAFPDPLEPFERPEGDGTVRIAAWNVAGLKACEKKGKFWKDSLNSLAAIFGMNIEVFAFFPTIQVSRNTSKLKMPIFSF